MSQPATTLLSARPSFLYRAALVAVAIVMAVLPVIYVALTGLALWGVYLFATHEFLAIWHWPISGRGGLLAKTFCSFTPLLTGGTAAFFMVKPLFARLPKRMQPLTLTAENEPRVHGLVHEVCRIVGAPVPRRIELSCDLNASAHFDRGLRGFFGNGLILTLGMPLAAGLTQRELAGVIAHEFGHFRQGGGMRVSYLIRRLNGWFARVIYQRDSWDEMIEGWAAGTRDSYWALMVGCVRFGVGFSRGVLWLLMNVGNVVGSALQRQMEIRRGPLRDRAGGQRVVRGDLGEIRRAGWGGQGYSPQHAALVACAVPASRQPAAARRIPRAAHPRRTPH